MSEFADKVKEKLDEKADVFVEEMRDMEREGLPVRASIVIVIIAGLIALIPLPLAMSLVYSNPKAAVMIMLFLFTFRVWRFVRNMQRLIRRASK